METSVLYGAAEMVWATPDGDSVVAYIARVSNHENQHNDETAPRLIEYLIRHKHWSPFEMVSACVEIKTTRDIGRQILRHRSFSFQEFSGRYASYDACMPHRDVRMQDAKNRQSSHRTEDATVRARWETLVGDSARNGLAAYEEALSMGVAKECARALLPEGLTPTRMYMSGTLRSWIHYVQERTAVGVQLEHRMLAERISLVLHETFPNVMRAVDSAKREKSDV